MKYIKILYETRYHEFISIPQPSPNGHRNDYS